MFIRVSLPAMIALIMTGSCKTPRAQDNAQLRHVFGKTWETREKPVEPCKNSDESASGWKYVSALVDHITSKNPTTFKGNLSRKSICVRIEAEDIVNAAMEVRTGTVRIFPKILNVPGLDTDAAFAAILSHELAHFTMGHHLPGRKRVPPAGYDMAGENRIRAKIAKLKTDADSQSTEMIKGFFSENKGDVERVLTEMKANQTMLGRYGRFGFPGDVTDASVKFSTNPDFQNSDNYFRQTNNCINAAMDETKKNPGLFTSDSTRTMEQLAQKSQQLQTDMDALRQKIYDAEGELKVHQIPITQVEEQEADEVGFELFIRAGFSPDVFSQTFITMAKDDTPNAGCDHISPTSKEPPRLTKGMSPDTVHPNFCWRYYDIKFSERKKHARDYAPLMSKNPIINLPHLDQARAAVVSKK